MFWVVRRQSLLLFALCVMLLAGAGLSLRLCSTAFPSHLMQQEMSALAILPVEDAKQQESQPMAANATPEPGKKFIKWVEFNVPKSALEKAYQYDIKTYETDVHVHWIEVLAYLGAKYGGSFSRYKIADMDNVVKKLKSGLQMDEIAANMTYYAYYLEAYTAVLGGMVGEYRIQTEVNGEMVWEDHYGLKAFSPIAKGYGFNDYDDFGSQRSYGYARRHLGHDILASVGTPVIAMESGYVEAMGWNQYGGWRIGIRSFDGKRYYYYAHLRKDRPYSKDLSIGKLVKAGDVIGYVGMTGYSTKENVNNIKTPHLHIGLQLIFDESQKEGLGEIWVDPYDLFWLLQKNKSAVIKDENKESFRKFKFEDFDLPS